MKKVIILVVLCLSAYHATAQRIPFADLFNLVKIVVDGNQDQILDVNAYLRSNSEDWSRPTKNESTDEFAITWPYNVSGSQFGYLTTTFKTITNTDGTTQHLGKLTFAFPYKVQYDDYLQNVQAHASLVNSFTNNGASYRIYESTYYTWAFIVIPAGTHTFFMDGIPTEAYTIEVHRKLQQ
jgi:hypothetical protein